MPNTLKISEIFYSIQGEGTWIGTPIIFIRLAGCSMGCDFCDTKYSWNGGTEMSVDEIIETIEQFNAKRVCITGGEPMEQNLTDLITSLHSEGYMIHLETNGAWPIDFDMFDWVTVSPKKYVLAENVYKADEVKYVITQEQDLINGLTYAKMNNNIFFVPVDNDLSVASMIIEFIKQQGGIKLGWQLQKTTKMK